MGSSQSIPEKEVKKESEMKNAEAEEDDDEPDDWDKRIFSTGCAAENTKMNDCYFEKKDWRLCSAERVVTITNANGTPQLETFRKCWKMQQNDQRTEMKDA